MKSIEMTGKTVEDAIKAGLRELNCDSTDVVTDIIDLGSPGLFGMFGRLAKVKLTLKENDPDLDFDFASITAAPEERSEPKQQKKAQPKPELDKPAPAPKKPKKQADKPPREEQAPEALIENAAPAERKEKPAPRERTRKPERERETPREPREPRPAFEPETAQDLPPTDPNTLSELGRAAYDFVSETTTRMGVPVEVRVKESEEHISIQMIGDTLGILIGRRGETLDSLQYLTSLVINKGRDKYVRVLLDTEHYRFKREEALIKLANRMAGRARKIGGRVALEPMNPHERRILHSALQDNPYVTTHSEGEEPYRRVIITLKNR